MTLTDGGQRPHIRCQPTGWVLLQCFSCSSCIASPFSLTPLSLSLSLSLSWATNKRQNWQSSSRATSFCLSCLTLALGAASAGIMALPHPTAYTYFCMYVCAYVRVSVCVFTYVSIRLVNVGRRRRTRNACFRNWPHYFAQFNSSLRQSFQLNISQVCRGGGAGAGGGGALHIERTSGHPRLSYPLTSAYANFPLAPPQRLSHSHAHFRRFTAKL